MSPRKAAERTPMRRLLATPDYLRLWAAGGLANSMRWVEILVAGIFTFEVTGSALAVALVQMARAAPMLLAGAFTGAVAEALDRRRILLAGQAAVATGAFAVAALAATGRLQVWHLAASGLVAGVVWAGEHSVRRRMVAEAAGGESVVAAIAFDTTTASTTRLVGPLLGGLAYGTIGVAAAFAIAGAVHLAAFALVLAVRQAQERRPLRPRALLADIADAARIARRHPTLLATLGVTVAMNVFAFSHIGVLPAFGRAAFDATPFQIGLLAAAEPVGALAGGLLIASGRHRSRLGAGALILGSGLYMVALIAAAGSSTLWLALAVLAIGGLGTALFASLQTSLALTEAPPEARSRMLGLITTCIGTGPIGVLAVGLLAEAVGAPAAIALMAACGIVLLAVVWAATARMRGAADRG
jgi:MFS family permease